MPQRPLVYVHLLPSLIPAGALKGGVAVVIDVLRATTTMIHGLAAGCDAIIPCGEIDEARRVAGTFPSGLSLLAGERDGLRIDGFDLGNSPGECSPEVCTGKTMVMTTTNGTKAILGSLDADRVFISAFVNRRATVEALKLDGRTIHLVCSGTDGEISLEDSLYAGSLASEIDAWAWAESEGRSGSIKLDPGDSTFDTVFANDQAEIAASLWRENEAMIEDGYSLADALGDGKGGRRIIDLNLEADLEDAAQVDRFPFAAELFRDPLRIVPSRDGLVPRLRLVGL